MNLVERVKRILISPQTEWSVIDTEPTTPVELYKQYIAPLAAITPIAQLIGLSIFGINVLGVRYRFPILSGLVAAIVTYVLVLAGTYALALIIDTLAPTFNGKRNPIQALKVAAYSLTAFWIAGIFAIIPPLSPLMIVGVYSLYLLYLGLPVLMKVPQDKALPYTGVVVIAGIVVFVLVGIIGASLR